MDNTTATRGKTSSMEPFITEPTAEHTHTFILLHGLGSDGVRFGREFLDTATTSKGIRLHDMLPHVRFVFPTAERRRSSAFNRAMLRQWFDIACLSDLSIRQEVQYQGMAKSASTIRTLIEIEAKSLPLGNIILGGLSQGCAMSLSVLLSLDHSLGGFIGLSGRLLFQKELARMLQHEITKHSDEYDPFEDSQSSVAEHPMTIVSNFQRDALSIVATTSTPERTAMLTPVFLGHGAEDTKVPCDLGVSAAETLQMIGMDVTWKSYAGQGRWYKVPDEIDDIVEFLQAKTNAFHSVT